MKSFVINMYSQAGAWEQEKKLKLNTIASLLVSKKLKQLLKSMLNNTSDFPKLTANDRTKCMPYFEEDMKRLQNIIDNDISIWFR